MKVSIDVSGDSVVQAQQTNTAIKGICASLTDIMDLTQLIASAAKEQSITSADISDQVSALSGASFEILELSKSN